MHNWKVVKSVKPWNCYAPTNTVLFCGRTARIPASTGRILLTRWTHLTEYCVLKSFVVHWFVSVILSSLSLPKTSYQLGPASSLKKFNSSLSFQCLLMLLDSPLNRAGLLQVYIHTAKNVLIEVHPQTRIPRTFDRFCGLMVQLLYKLRWESWKAFRGPKACQVI